MNSIPEPEEDGTLMIPFGDFVIYSDEPDGPKPDLSMKDNPDLNDDVMNNKKNKQTMNDFSFDKELEKKGKGDTARRVAKQWREWTAN